MLFNAIPLGFAIVSHAIKTRHFKPHVFEPRVLMHTIQPGTEGSHGASWQVVPDVITGTKRICLAISEVVAGSDVANITTVAAKRHFLSV